MNALQPRLLSAAFSVAALTLSACAPLPASAPADIAVRGFSNAFELQGRISASNGNQAASGHIEWTHDRGTDRFTLLTPLGQIAARLDADALGARLVTAEGESLTADSAAALLPRVLGVEVPAERLSRWAQAAPAAEAEIRNLDAAGRPAVVIDQGWRIEYPEYAGTAGDAPPARLDISRGDARIRLVIDSWTTLP
ncbi:lipoprotein insertase outer membrane protein LolB [Thauera linaloolentis]|uniref:Outer-membrane lipoprotein LolB n=1 Tax=Thauera linaloolentis (strain DSM 12138 / JCM 21573 / CCUG 41526 / CIP 105981 / IAM 15112 / NBRC 102519 / 47Lol) TaxID=1123367 RepID=N6YC75_THAL4|nr:lipoprotein insertase outer membrane protein LolB [Thauera linaloolentis]ENO89130.1 outer membrane lipoprotein LolB [Thauera linaloolentis 47Lol = DSM 12138]MCM8565723.1 lipoprotein insertase outer membrane protein LolB [Thauera linaloolentis]